MVGLGALACAAGAAAALVALSAGSAAAPSQWVGRDAANGAQFSLMQRTMTVTLSPSSRVRRFAGQSVRASCVSQLARDNGVALTVRWAPKSHTLRVHFRADVGPAPVYCSVDTASLKAHSYHVEAVLR